MHGIFAQTFSITGNWGLWVTPAALRVLDAFFCFFFLLFLSNYGELSPAQRVTQPYSEPHQVAHSTERS